MKKFYLAFLPLFFFVLASAQHSHLAPMKSFLSSENNPQLENTSQHENLIQTRSSVTHTISSGSYYYYPSSLTIEVGDSVVWLNDGGYHDVNGDINSITDQPFNNPETFDSDPTSVAGAVIYAHKFTIPGTYNYDCSVGSHAANGMVGSILVNSASSSAIWSDDFSDASKWTIANSTGDNQDWVITDISDDGVGYGTGTWDDADFVTSANNGYALYDSDILGSGGGYQDATITYNETLNLSSYPNVLLQFNNRGRLWQTTQNFVEVSNDGGASWVAYEVNAEETTSQLFENITQAAQFTMNENALLRNLVTVYDMQGTPGLIASVPVYPKVSGLSAIAAGDSLSNTDIAATAVDITAAEFGAMASIQDIVVESSPLSVAQDTGKVLGDAVAQAMDEVIVDLFSSATTDVGTSSGELTIDQILKAAATLRNKSVPMDGLVAVINPLAAYNLKKTLLNSGTNPSSNDLVNTAARNYFLGRVAGVDIYESASVDVDGTPSAVNAVFHKSAIGMVMKRDLRIATERDEALRGFKIVASAAFGANILDDNKIVKIASDAAL